MKRKLPAPGPLHEKLDVYQLELGFLAWVTPLLREVRHAAEGYHREVCDQLDRASLSTLLNTAEGNGKRRGRQRAGLATAERVREGKFMLVRIAGMLTRLVQRFDKGMVRPSDSRKEGM